MSNTMEYKGYIGSVEFSAEDRCLFGKIEFIDDLVLFDGSDVDSLETAFHEAVDQYLLDCEEHGRLPGVAFKGSFNVRLGEQLHRDTAMNAKRKGLGLNEYVKRAVELQNSQASTAHAGNMRNATLNFRVQQKMDWEGSPAVNSQKLDVEAKLWRH